ncbi:PPOX class F420-dependent oxidoreductase [Streptomyces sp. YIM S03343]
MRTIFGGHHLHPHGKADPFPVAVRPHAEEGRITAVRVTFDLGKLLQAGAPAALPEAVGKPAWRRLPDHERPTIMSFTEEETDYIRSQRLARVATVSSDGQPDVTPVGFEFDGRCFYIGGYDPTNTRRARNVRDGNHKIALVIDDLVTTQPWTPRYLRVYGTAELVSRSSAFGEQQILKITPVTSWSMNLSGEWSAGSTHRLSPRKTRHQPTDGGE